MSTRDILVGLEEVSETSSGRWTARCPSHDDQTPSLSVASEGERLLVHCHAGCSTEDVMDALGLPMSALFLNRTGNGQRPTISATYDYTDEDGELLYQVVRMEPKTFRQRRPDGSGGWIWKLGDVRRVLYHLPDVVQAVKGGEPVYLVEGEKDADRLRREGLSASTSPGGAGKWRPEYSDSLKGADVVILPDQDEAGEKHARDVARSLRGIARTVRVVELPGITEHEDVSDWLDKGFTVETLKALAAKAEEWRETGREEADSPPRYQTMAALLADPSLLTPPCEIIPGLVWKGRATLLVAPAKEGKSTLVGQAIAAFTSGRPWLDQAMPPPGRVVVMAPDEHLGETIRRLEQAGADPERVTVVTSPAPEPLALLQEVLNESPADLVVVDSLTEYARIADKRGSPDQGDAGGWSAVLRPLVALAHEQDVGLLLVHHSRRVDGEFRGSGEIAAAVDAAVTMRKPDGDPTARKMESVARWSTVPWCWRLNPDGQAVMVEVGEGPSLDAQVLARVTNYPGSATNQIVQAIEARNTDIRRALDGLERAGTVESYRGPRNAKCWRLVGLEEPESKHPRPDVAGRGRDEDGKMTGRSGH